MSLDYRKIRTACLSLATLFYVGVVILAVAELAAAGHQVLMWMVIALAVALYWQARRLENLFATRLGARAEMDALAEELGVAASGQDPDYDWQRSMPKYSSSAFVSFQRETAKSLEALRHQGDSLDSMPRQSIWLSPGAASRAWKSIAFQAGRSKRALTDTVYWSTGAECVVMVNASRLAALEPVSPTLH